MLVEDAIQLAEDFMSKYPSIRHWKFGIDDKANKRAGNCSYRNRRISLSLGFIVLNPRNLIIETILHEIAHARVHEEIGPNHHHDDVWRAMCVQIGYTPTRLINCDQPLGKYVANCPTCRLEFRKFRKVKRIFYCTKCGPVDGKLEYKERELMTVEVEDEED